MNTILDLVDRGLTHWDDASVLVSVGAELEERSRFVQARPFLERAIELDPTGQPKAYIHLTYSWFRDSGANDEGRRGGDVLRKGIEATDSDLIRAILGGVLGPDDAAEAVDLLTAAAERHSDVHPLTIAAIWMWRGGADRALEIMGDAHEAIATALASNDPDLMSDVAGLCFRLRLMEKLELDTADLEPLHEECMQIAPERFSSYSVPMMIYRGTEQWEQLGRVCMMALRHMPDEETVMHNLAIANRELGDLRHAEKWYQRAIGAKPSFAGARLGLAKLYESQDRIDEALEIAREVPATNPGYALGALQAAVILDRHGYSDEAVTMVQGAKARITSWMHHVIERDDQLRALWEKAQ